MNIKREDVIREAVEHYLSEITTAVSLNESQLQLLAKGIASTVEYDLKHRYDSQE